MQLIELEQVDAVLEALLKASVNRIPKLALAATNAILRRCGFGTPKVVPPTSFEGVGAVVRREGRQGSRCGEGHHG